MPHLILPQAGKAARLTLTGAAGGRRAAACFAARPASLAGGEEENEVNVPISYSLHAHCTLRLPTSVAD